MSDSTALALADQGSAALAAFGFNEGEPLKPSRLELLQPIQIADEPGLVAGKYRDAQSNLQYDTINVVPILIQDGRVLFPPGGELGAKPVCRSNDWAFPIIGDDIVRQDCGNGCRKCEHSQWKRIGGKPIRPACNETMSVLFAELETQFIYRYNVKGVALGPVKDWKETLRKIIWGAKAKGQFIPPYGLTFQLSSVKVKGNKGTYYIPKFTPTGQVHPDDLSQFQSIFQYFSARRNGPVDEPAPSDPVGKAIEGEYVGSPATYEEA